MNADGSGQTQLTKEAGGFPFSISSDGEWVYYHHGIDRTLWRVSVRTGGEQLVLDKRKCCFAILNDGSRIAFPETAEGKKFIYIVDSVTGARLEALTVGDQGGVLTHVAWLPKGDGVAYIVSTNNYADSALWIHKVDAAAQPQRIAQFDKEIGGHGLAISPDGKRFAVSSGGWLHDAVLVTGLR